MNDMDDLFCFVKALPIGLLFSAVVFMLIVVFCR